MTRRTLLYGKLATLASIRFRAHAAAQVAAPRVAALPRAKWIENGIIDAGGSHEPYTFVVRRGGQRLDARKDYEDAQSEELIRRLKEQGVEVFHTHLYKGAGMAHERAEMEDARRVAAIAHRHGLKVDSYLQWNTMIYEPFFVEEPRAQDWIQRDAAGQPIMLTYGYQQSYRYRPCFSNQEYLDYLKKIVRFAVEEVKTDFIHFDNFDLNAEPESCHCEWCVRGFREFLRKKYTAGQRKERFGFENTDYVNPPRWNRSNPPERMEIIFDPGIQEWIDYRCQSMTDALGQMATLIKSLNPEVAVEVNPHGITGGNRAWQAGLDHARFLKYTEVFWTEERNLPAVHPDGRIISTIRSYKLARAFNNILFTYTLPDQAAMAECLAFNQTIGSAGRRPRARRYAPLHRVLPDQPRAVHGRGGCGQRGAAALLSFHHVSPRQGAARRDPGGAGSDSGQDPVRPGVRRAPARPFQVPRADPARIAVPFRRASSRPSGSLWRTAAGWWPQAWPGSTTIGAACAWNRGWRAWWKANGPRAPIRRTLCARRKAAPRHASSTARAG